MRSYLKIVRSPDLTTILPFKFIVDHGGGFGGTLMRLQRDKQLAPCQAYNLIAQVPVWIGFNKQPQNLSFGALDPNPLNTESARLNDGTSILQNTSGITLANSIFEILPWETHPKN